MTVIVSATAITDDPLQVVRALAVLTQAATGLVADGMDVSVHAHRADDDDKSDRT